MGLFKKKKTNTEVELQNATPIEKSEEVFIKSTEEINKTDGVVVIATIGENAITPSNNPMPKQIDIDERRQRIIASKKEKQKKKIKNSVANKKASTVTSLIVLVVIGILGGFYFYIKKQKNTELFTLKTLNVELGSKLSNSVSNYVNKDEIDELAYTLDISSVDTSKVGEYKYKVTYQNITKEGTIIVKDSTSPSVETKDLIISVNESFTPEDFINKCSDISNCHYIFENEQVLNSNQQTGEYEIYIVVTDDYNNVTRKKATLKVVDNIRTLTCTQETPYDESSGYYKISYFEISYYENTYLRHNIYNEFHFNDQDKYNNYEQNLNDGKHTGYTFDSEKRVITNTPVFNLNPDYNINNYYENYTNQGYTCRIK